MQPRPENPTHYNVPGTDKQLIHVLEAASWDYEPWDFFLWASVMQYIMRWRYKGTPIADLRKARVYLDWLLESVETNGEETYRTEASYNVRAGAHCDNLQRGALGAHPIAVAEGSE